MPRALTRECPLLHTLTTGLAYLTTLDDVIASRGGNPLVVGGKVIGAIGVSGGSGSQDDVVSQAGVAALN